MTSPRFSYFLIAAFVACQLIFIFIKYTTDKDISRLMVDNEKLLNEFSVNNKLESLEKDAVLIQNKIRDMIATGDPTFIDGVEATKVKMRSDLESLQGKVDDDSIKYFTSGLDSLIRVSFGYYDDILKTYIQKGRPFAEALIDTQRRKRLNYSILTLSQKISNARQNKLVRLSSDIDHDVKKMQRLDSIFFVFVLTAATLLFWYILSTIATQRRLISQVSESEKKVKEIAKVKENFLANMSHEIRTPMNSIMGFTELLAQKNMDDEARHFVQTLQRSGESLLSIVNDILDISKIEAGMMRIEKAPFSLRGLVGSVEMMMLSKANEKGLKFSSEVEGSIPDVLEGDATRLTQILFNLISNALKFTSQGFISLTISTEEFTGSVVRLKIDVRDSGIGIEPQKLKYIFGRFQQADATITRQYGGSGLGLSIVKDLVELQQGVITAESEPGKGTVFHVIIPYLISNRHISDSFSVTEVGSPVTKPAHIHILIAEDNEFNQSLLSHIFHGWNVPFDIAANGKEAIEKLKTDRYDLVLMDIQMPVMDGYTAARKIRNELRLDLPIIAMTAHALPGEKEKCLSYGMNDYLAKPVKQEQLAWMIQKFASSFPRARQGDPAITVPAHANRYQYISLDYLKEVSAGNKKYERDVTQKFINAVPLVIQDLRVALDEGSQEKMRRLAHNLKSTISIMGLNDLLNPLLDKIEAAGQQVSHIRETVEQLADLLSKALEEARAFQATLQ